VAEVGSLLRISSFSFQFPTVTEIELNQCQQLCPWDILLVCHKLVVEGCVCGDSCVPERGVGKNAESVSQSALPNDVLGWLGAGGDFTVSIEKGQGKPKPLKIAKQCKIYGIVNCKCV
jgi:hypothetical protein